MTEPAMGRSVASPSWPASFSAGLARCAIVGYADDAQPRREPDRLVCYGQRPVVAILKHDAAGRAGPGTRVRIRRG